MLEVAHSCLPGLTRRMERIAKTHEPAHRGFVGYHAGDSTAERFAADHEPFAAAEFIDRVAPRSHKHRTRVGRAAGTRFAPPVHVRKLESRNADASLRYSLGDRYHEG